MLRNLSVTNTDGSGILGTPRVGVLASELPTGFPFAGLLNNDVDVGDPAGTLYRVEITSWPSAGTLSVDEYGSFSFTGAPDGVYTGTEKVYKDNVPTAGTYSLTVGQGAAQQTDTTPPSVPGSLSVTAPTSSGAHVTWSAAADEAGGSGLAGYEISVDTGTPAYASIGNVTAYDITGKAASTTYTVRVRAVDSAGNRGTAATVSFSTTATADTTLPTMTGSVTISAVTSSGAHAAWQAATDNVAVTGYEVSIDTGAASWANVGNVTSYDVSGKAAGTVYTFRLRAYDAAGNRAAPITASFTTTAAPDTTAPTMNGGVTLSAVTASSVHAAWSAASDGVGVTGYELSCDTGTPNWLNLGSVLVADVSSLAASTNYTLRVRAYDAAGNRSTPATATFTTGAASSGGGPVTTAFTPSASRTVAIQAASKGFTAGAFWDLSDPKKPRGTKDPDASIDITFDWTAWLADMGDTQIASVAFVLTGVTSAGNISTGAKASVIVSGGVVSSTPASVTCRITTDSVPPRIDDRTVLLTIGDQ